LKEIATKIGLGSVGFFTKEESNRVGRGKYRVPSTAISMQGQVIQMPKQQVEKSGSRIQNVTTALDEMNLVPAPIQKLCTVWQLRRCPIYCNVQSFLSCIHLWSFW
jgi:hypothetical protein